MKFRLFPILIVILVLNLIVACSHSTDPKIHVDKPVETGDGWETALPQEVGVDSEILEQLVARIDSTDNHMIHSFLVVRNNRLIFEHYWSGFDVPLSGDLNLVEKDFDMNMLHYQASVSKSVTSVLFGVATDMQYIGSVDDSVFAYFPEYTDLKNDANSKVLLKNLLGMCSGFDWNEFEYGFDDQRDSHNRMFASNDVVQYLFSRPMVNEPGEVFLYNSGDTNILGEIVRRSTESDYLTDFAEEYLFEPLGIESYNWNRFPLDEHVTFASGGLFLRPRDMAKIGQLYLDEGVWNGQKVLSAKWVRDSFAMTIPFVENYRTLYGYGYQWWLGTFPDGTDYFRADGWGGQYIYVLPEHYMVVVHTAGGFYESRPLASTRLVEEYVLTAIIE